MGKAAKWLRLFLTGKKEKEKYGLDPVMRSGPLSTPPVKEKKRWSFRRSSTGTALEQKSASVRGHARRLSDSDVDQKRQAAAMAVAKEAAAAAAAQAAAAAVIRLTNAATEAVEEAAAIKIQSVFRAYLV